MADEENPAGPGARKGKEEPPAEEGDPTRRKDDSTTSSTLGGGFEWEKSNRSSKSLPPAAADQATADEVSVLRLLADEASGLSANSALGGGFAWDKSEQATNPLERADRVLQNDETPWDDEQKDGTFYEDSEFINLLHQDRDALVELVAKNADGPTVDRLQKRRELLIVHLLRKICSFRDPSNQLFLSCMSWFFNERILTSQDVIQGPDVARSQIFNAPLHRLHNFLDVSVYRRDYTEEEMLGQGAFGSVYKCKHKVDGKTYAVKKILFRTPNFSSTLRATILREVQILAHLNNPHITKYYHAFIEQISKEEAERRFPDGSSSREFTSDSDVITPKPMIVLASDDKTAGQELANATPPAKNAWIKPMPYIGAIEKFQYLELFLITEFCGHCTLLDYVRHPNRKPDKQAALFVIAQLLLALDAIHTREIIHRDIKPSNIFMKPPETIQIDKRRSEPYFCDPPDDLKKQRSLTGTTATREVPGMGGIYTLEDYTVKLGDFGLSKQISVEPAENPNYFLFGSNGEEDAVARLTSGQGTAFYCAPEAKTSEYGCKADVYSLGVVLFELLHPAFQTQQERYQTFKAIFNGEGYEALEAQHGKSVCAFLRRMLEKDPAVRASTSDLLSAAILREPLDKMRLRDSPSASSNNLAPPLDFDTNYTDYESLSKDQLISLLRARDEKIKEQEEQIEVLLGATP